MSLYLHAVQPYGSTAVQECQQCRQYTSTRVLAVSSVQRSGQQCAGVEEERGMQACSTAIVTRVFCWKCSRQHTHHTQLASPPNSADLASTRAMSRVGSRLPSWMVSGPR